VLPKPELPVWRSEDPKPPEPVLLDPYVSDELLLPPEPYESEVLLLFPDCKRGS
jgi:hypothetical protein